MGDFEELKREAEEVKEKVRRDFEEVRDILRKVAEEARDRGKIKVAETVQQAERRIEGTTQRVEKRIEKAMAMAAKWATSPGAASEIDAGNMVTKEMDFGDFTNIEVNHTFNVSLICSDSYRVAITAGEKLFEHINVAQSGNTVRISLKPFLFHFKPQALEARIEMPILNRLRLTAATKGMVKGFFSQEDFDLHLAGASSLDLDIEAGKTRLEISGASRLSGSLKADDAEFILSGASRAELKGSANTVVLNAWGASIFDLADFVLNDTDVHLNGASQAKINASGKLDLDLCGASKLSYTGDPTLHDINVSGASTLIHR